MGHELPDRFHGLDKLDEVIRSLCADHVHTRPIQDHEPSLTELLPIAAMIPPGTRRQLSMANCATNPPYTRMDRAARLD